MTIEIKYSSPYYYLVDENGKELYKSRYYQDLQGKIKELEEAKGK